MSHPPTSVERSSLPSLKAPAPPHPCSKVQGSQLTHPKPRLAGHLRFSRSGPFSSITILSGVELFLVSSRAENMPAGPVPTMMTS